VTSGVFVIYFYREINNGILEATSFRGAVQIELPPFLFICWEIYFQPPDSESRYPFLNPTDYPEDFPVE
jgi:hypothetical protein